MKNWEEKVYRILDANLNRCREGIRVVEEIARFYLNDEKLSSEFKSLRHSLTKIVKTSLDEKKLLTYRQSEKDVGAKGLKFGEKKRGNLKEIAQANLRRSQEALRVLEEFTKLNKPEASLSFKRKRFKLYQLEQKLYQKLK
jgi:thiamine-phosphate pyrophosphorylase